MLQCHSQLIKTVKNLVTPLNATTLLTLLNFDSFLKQSDAEIRIHAFVCSWSIMVKPLSKVYSFFLYLGSQVSVQCLLSKGRKSINQQDNESQRISLWIKNGEKRTECNTEIALWHYQNPHWLLMCKNKKVILQVVIETKSSSSVFDWEW